MVRWTHEEHYFELVLQGCMLLFIVFSTLGPNLSTTFVVPASSGAVDKDELRQFRK